MIDLYFSFSCTSLQNDIPKIKFIKYYQITLNYVRLYEIVVFVSQYLTVIYILWQDYGNGPNPQKIYKKDGYDTYLKNEFPKMDYITGCVIIPNDYDYDKKEENGKQPSYEELAARIFVDEDEEEL